MEKKKLQTTKKEQDERDAATNGVPVLERGTAKGLEERLPKSRLGT
jgi:hypothetical protein